MRPSRFAHFSDDSPEAAPNETLFIILVFNNKVILDNANKLLQSIDSVRANIRTDKNIHNRVADFQRA